ncbi:MAG: hypothetical protein ABL930_06165 [Pseudobdellovibrio sp.]
MKLTIIVLCSFICSLSFSATRLRFFIGDHNAIAFITPTDIYGNADSDSINLYQMMIVPEQDTMLGKGKSIVMGDNGDFNLVCGEYRNQCQVILNKTANTVISSSKKYMRFEISGDRAAQLTSMFKLNSNGEAYFKSTDKLFRFSGNSQSFLFEASDSY